MGRYQKPQVFEQDEEEDVAAFAVSGPRDQIEAMAELLGWVNYCCAVGHGGHAEIFVDGDGAGSLSIESSDVYMPKVKDFEEAEDEGEFVPDKAEGPEFTVSIGA